MSVKHIVFIGLCASGSQNQQLDTTSGRSYNAPGFYERISILLIKESFRA